MIKQFTQKLLYVIINMNFNIYTSGGDMVNYKKLFYTLPQVAEKYGKTPAQVRYAVEQGRLNGLKIGWQWTFMTDELPDTWPETPRTSKRLERKGKLE